MSCSGYLVALFEQNVIITVIHDFKKIDVLKRWPNMPIYLVEIGPNLKGCQKLHERQTDVFKHSVCWHQSNT